MAHKEKNIDPLGGATEVSLDPADWPAFRRLAHAALDDAITFLEQVRERPVWQAPPAEVREHFTAPLPHQPTQLEDVYREFSQKILPYATGNIHPRFFGWVHGSGIAGNIVAEMLAATMNSNCGGRNHGAIYVERQVITWLRDLFGFPAEADGLLVSGSSMANLIALGAARNAAQPEMRRQGIHGQAHGLVAYASSEVHVSADKAMEILGMGRAARRSVPVRADYTMNLVALEQRIKEDRANGLQPFCVIGTAGTVNTGATDNLQALAAICAREKLWFHVDGAFGAICMTSEKLRSRLAGIERADSLAFDFHKWMHVQYDAGCVMLRSGKLLLDAYSSRPAYLDTGERGMAAGENWPCDLGPELSRGFRALKVWFALKEHGVDLIGKLAEQNCSQAEYLRDRIASEPQLELLAPVSMNIVCFRVLRDSLQPAALNQLNKDLVADLQESGIAAPSTTTLDGKLAIRVNITNHRTRREDMDVLVDALLRAAEARA